MARAISASEPHVAEAATEVLERGNAVDAVVAGVLMAAAESAGVLLGPVQLLAAGAGLGLFALDGRVVQPGRGVQRPRGFLSQEPIPDSARVAVPMLPGALATALASAGSSTLYRASGPARAWVRSRSPERAGVLEHFARRGAPALTEGAIGAELLAVAGRAAGGLLTEDDLSSARPGLRRCDDESVDSHDMWTPPWRPEAALDASRTHIVAAVDARGLMAVACYEVHEEGLAVPALGMIAPRFAEPVMRGRPRIAPGEPRPAAAPIGLRWHHGQFDFALGVGCHAAAEGLFQGIVAMLEESRTLDQALPATSEGRIAGVFRYGDSARALTRG